MDAEVEKLQCSLICEKEKNTTLAIENDATKAKLQKARDQAKSLEAELDGMMEGAQAKVQFIKSPKHVVTLYSVNRKIIKML